MMHSRVLLIVLLLVGTAAAGKKPPEVSVKTLEVEGKLTSEQVAAELTRSRDKFLACYKSRDRKATIEVSFVIDERGGAVMVVTMSDEAQLAHCLRAPLRKLTFPRPSAGTVAVNAELVFSPGS